MNVKPTFFLLTLLTCAQSQPDRIVGGSCEDCELIFEGMPSELKSRVALASFDEPGEKLTITGTVYRLNSKTPASGVILYLYHTDAKGKYSVAADQQLGKMHGHLRGWIKTDSLGNYSFTTVRPASYPNSKAPQHIHPLIKERGYSVYWIDEYLFDDDPLLTPAERARQEKRGGSGIIRLTKDLQGHWVGRRDIVLGLNIPNY